MLRKARARDQGGCQLGNNVPIFALVGSDLRTFVLMAL